MTNMIHNKLTPTSSAERIAIAKQWQQQGGKVIGYVSNNIPLELIYAAGFMPFHLIGDPDEETPLADAFLEPAFDPVSRSIFDRLLKGDYDFVEAIVLPRTHDAFQRLYYYMQEIGRKYPQYHLPRVHLLNLLYTERPSSKTYNVERFREFSAFLNSDIVNERLGDSILLFNNIREQLAIFNDLRSSSFISSRMSFDVYASVQSLPPDEILPFIKTVNANLSKENSQKNTKRFRLVVAGNGVDHSGLHDLADSMGITIVGDYHSLGNHFLPAKRVAVDGDLIDNLARYYQQHSISGRSFYSHENDLVAFAKNQGAQGILFHYLLKEEALSWHYPKQNKVARQNGLKTAILSDQPYQLNKTLLTQAMTQLISEEVI